MTPTAASRVAASLARVASLAACPARCSRVSADRAPRPAGGRRWLLVDRQPHLDPRRARAADPPGPPRPPRQAPQGRPILGVPERRAAGSDARQAGQRRRQGELWAAQPDIEPVFGQLKTVQGARRFMRRGWAPARPSGSCCAAPTTCSLTGPRGWVKQAPGTGLLASGAAGGPRGWR
jgi:hypothetical protein